MTGVAEKEKKNDKDLPIKGAGTRFLVMFLYRK